MEIEVAYASAARQWVVGLELETGATVADALAAVAQRPPFTELALESMPVGAFGELVQPDQVLQDHDRVELYRPLQQDPKAARRHRAAREKS